MTLSLPGFVDGHCHLDKTLWGMPWRPHVAPLEEMIRRGTTVPRTHVDIDTAR
jgi:cytosine/adenosine deaminase-related metal-dependent hydrolase